MMDVGSTAPRLVCVRVGVEAATLIATLQAATLPAIGAQSWSTASICTMLAVPGAIADVVTVRDEPSGVAVGRCVADEFELLYLGVLPATRRCGLGRELLAAQLGAARAAGAGRCFLEVAEGNVPARALYDAAGFERVGCRVGYYRDAQGVRHDALLLCKSLAER